MVAAGEAVTREYIGGLLRGRGWEVVLAATAEAAFATVSGRPLDVAILEAELPGVGGVDACRLLRTQASGYLPLLLLTGTAGPVGAFRAGADDVLTQPLDEGELLERMARLRAIRTLHEDVERSQEALRSAEGRDATTGLFGDRYLEERLAEELQRARRYREPLACVLVDLDQREPLRTSGEARFEASLLELGRRCLGTVRVIDLAGRTSRDEVLLVLPSTPLTGALAVAERIWRAVGARPFVVPASAEASPGAYELALTCSAGVGLFPSHGVTTKDTLLEATRTALAEARRGGGNRICLRQHQGYLYRPG